MQIKIEDRHIHAKEQGAGELTLVFMHYWGGSARTWQHVIDKLSANFHCVAYDHRGWGESSPADSYRISDLADDALEVVCQLGLKRYVLIGHSMGGKTAQLAGSRRPAGLEALVLVAPALPIPQPIPAEERKVIETLYYSREGVEQVISNTTALPLSNALREQIIEDSMRGSDGAKLAWPQQSMLEDISSEVGKIAVPTLVIVGENDAVDRPETLRAEVVERIKGATLQVLPKAGHLSPLEIPEVVAEAIATFVKKLA